ncbi:MAG: 3-phosphoserine/phosphohydroxythreonine transaminase [Betaproteobacteria bacterium]|nr:3-phosphoserine/phosphohydroxythreonine transaminase [Betaproteobacteria bacterium]
MQRTHNFSAGPSAIPTEVLAQAQAELLDYRGTGMSVMEMSHRGKVFMEVAHQAESDLRELLAIPANYKVLFLQGGGKGEFSLVPMNLMGVAGRADYVNTGHWSEGAIQEARKYGAVDVIASSADRGFTYVPAQTAWSPNPGAAYRHICTNETIHGVEYFWTPEIGDGVPLVADMSSHILSRPLEVSKFGCIYGGAQKNIGPSGLTVVIVREDLLGRAHPLTPSVFDYAQQAASDSMLNTPPTFGVYLAGLTFQWLKKRGGLAAMEAVNVAKAGELYGCIDASGGFYRNTVEKADRSRMNVPFFLKDESLNAEFLRQAEARGLSGLKGHKAVGGMRASIYNATGLDAVMALTAFMREFAQRHG